MSSTTSPLLVVSLLVLLAVVVTACTGGGDAGDGPTPDAEGTTEDTAARDPATETGAGEPAGGSEQPEEEPTTPRFAPAPVVDDGPLDPATRAALDAVVAGVEVPDLQAIEALGASGDPRVLWVLSDILRFAFDEATADTATDAADTLSGLDLRELADFPWGPLTDHLIAWDLPAYDGYVQDKAAIFTAVEPGWRPFFESDPSTIDWRLTSWGGVRIDDRPAGATSPCERGCIPALEDPELTPASAGDWYPDDAVVFGVQIGGDTVALPRNIMEVHEMVNATIGGSRVAIPYCTLCGAAQVFLTDEVEVEGQPVDVVMRTSGLLHRSNKVMYDLTTGSVFDTFTGAAISGPLLAEAVVLPQAPVVTSTWGEWRQAHPDTTIVAEDGGIGRRYSLDPLGGRDDDGPIFPIGQRDDRLGVHDQVLGVVLGDGTPVAFDVQAAREVLADGGEVTLAGVQLEADGGGLVASVEGRAAPSHQAFWFAWSQFHPDTQLWEGA